LKVSGIKYWAGRPWSTGQLKKGIQAMINVAKQFVFKPITPEPPGQVLNEPRDANVDAETPVLETPLSANFLSFFAEEVSNLHQRELESDDFEQALRAEIDSLKEFLFSREFVTSVKSSRDFWVKHLEQFPLLSYLAIILLSIPASSAFIERFFSVCGFQVKRFINMSDDLFEMRSMLKSNLDTLNSMAAK
jgi:hypothetical protein